ncbi:unnamed protein product [Clonostachys chloroleuca]|uniref:Uncharacterized protein n=1 Tax=Clonostachys chloroleuca TaxID=1926264 RepID=A0AA35M1A7_9HYPO|nr:unnamed protein product [Clonostachys chloroleuca]
MSAPTDTQTLLQRLREAEERAAREEERANQEKERANRAETERDQAAIERDQEEERANRAETERDQEREQTRPTTLDEYLEACHNLVYARLTVESDPSKTTTGSIRAYHKLIPEHLKQWTSFFDEQGKMLTIIYSFFPVIQIGVNKGFRHIFHNMPENLANYQELYRSIKHLGTNELQGRQIRSLMSNIRLGKDDYNPKERQTFSIKSITRDIT